MAKPGIRTYRFEGGELVKSGRDKILNAEKLLASLPQVEMPPTHYFVSGLYGRSILIPAGVCITGKVHKTESLDVVLYGRMAVYNEDGFVREVAGPSVFRTPAGVKKIGIALEDTLWLSVAACEGKTLDAVEDELFETCEGEPEVFNFATGAVLRDEVGA